jgi:hypothetical protein
MSEPDLNSEIEDKLLSIIGLAAKNGERCPTNWALASLLTTAMGRRVRSGGGIPSSIQNLVRKGKVTVRLFGHNYRQIEILDGKHAGFKTKQPEHDKLPYMTIDMVERLKRDNSPKW